MITHEELTVAHRCGRSSIAKFCAEDQRVQRGRRRGECVGVRRGPDGLQVKVDIPEPIAWDMPPEPKIRQQAMNSPDWK